MPTDANRKPPPGADDTPRDGPMRTPKRLYLNPRVMTEEEIVDAFMAFFDSSAADRPAAGRAASRTTGESERSAKRG